MIDSTTADALDALYLEIQAAPAGQSPAFEARLADLIREPMLVIDGRTLVTARYTLNITNALQLRAKNWYMKSLMEIGQANQPFASCWFEYEPVIGFVQGGTGSTGATIGLAACAAIARVWAEIIRRWLIGNIPRAPHDA
jgi:hypothetical protein